MCECLFRYSKLGPYSSAADIVFMYVGVCMYVCHACTQVRWAGLVRASLASPYTFHTSLSGEQANHERVKLWIDGQAQILKNSNSDIGGMLKHTHTHIYRETSGRL